MSFELKREYYANNTTNGSLIKKFEFSFVNNKREGLSKCWYETGRLLFVEEYKNGLLHGLKEQYHFNGTLECLSSYKEDIRNGACVFFTF